MDATLKALVGLIGGTDVEARCAALLVLTQIKAVDDRVVQAVGAALGAKNIVVRDFALGYFEQVTPRDGVAHLVPFLDAEEDALRQRAVGILATYGQAAIAAVKNIVKAAPRRRLNAIIDLCARVRTSTALDVLFNLIPGEDFDASRAACDALIASVPHLDTATARSDLFSRTDRLAVEGKGQRTALVGAAKLFGTLSDPKARKRLFAMFAADAPPVVRTHALAALAQCLRGQTLSAGEIATVLPLLDEDDETGIVRPAIQLLEDQSLDRSYVTELNRLAESPQPLVKRFAVHKLGAFESGSVVKTLIGYLTDESYARRDEASSSLKNLPAARTALMKEFLACDDERKAWTLSEILLVHERDWKRDTLNALWTQLERALEKRDDRLYTAYFQFLNALDPDDLAVRVRSRAERLRKSKAYALSAKWLGLLKDTPAFDAETQFALAVSELKSHAHALTGAVRRRDPALDLLRELGQSTFPAAERLRKERTLSPEELFYVAFNFAEGRPDERSLARELLKHLVARQGRTKIGKAAKNKLALLPG